MGLCYGSYVGTTVYVAAFSPVLATFLLAFVIALHSSLQHEVLHGHPFKEKWLSELTVFPAIGLFIPYQRFRDTHLAHHFVMLFMCLASVSVAARVFLNF